MFHLQYYLVATVIRYNLYAVRYVCVCVCARTHTRAYSSQYRDAGRTKEIKKNGNSIECCAPCVRQPYSREIPRVLWNPNVDYRVHKSAPLVPILILMNPVHNLPLCFFKIYFYIFLPLRLVLPSDVCPSSFPTETLYAFQNYDGYVCMYVCTRACVCECVILTGYIGNTSQGLSSYTGLLR